MSKDNVIPFPSDKAVRKLNVAREAPVGPRKTALKQELKQIWEEYQCTVMLLDTIQTRLDGQFKLIHAIASELEMLPSDDKNLTDYMD